MKIFYVFFTLFFLWATICQSDEIDTLVAKVKATKVAVATAQANYTHSVRALNDYLLGNAVVVPPIVVVVPTKKVSMVVYGSDSCAPCKAMIPVVDKLKGTGLNVRYTTDVSGIELLGTPTIVCYVGGVEVSRMMGYLGFDSLQKWNLDTEKWATK